MKNRSLGLNTEHILDIGIQRIDNDQRPLFRDKIKEHAGVENLTMASRNFMNGYANGRVRNSIGEQILTFIFKVDPEYISTLDLQLIQGNNFTESNMKNNDQAMIVNEKFVEEMFIEEDPIGKTYQIWGNTFTVMGVVKNFHFRDMRQPVRPAMLFTRQNMGNPYDRLLVKYHPQQLEHVIKHIQETYTEIAPGKTLDYTFWNEELANRYESEERWSKIIGYAAFIAIIISCLGLFGLTILLINQRIKEIGVRKVNGATAGEVLATILKSFIIWLIGALIIAAPVAYYIVNKWLENFPYRVLVSWWVFALAGIIALSIALLTVSWHSWRAANRNPVEALRYE